MRNNTSIFERLGEWRKQIQSDYAKQPAIHHILSLFQYQLCRYMAGDYMEFALPRGLLLYWKQGSGKTKGFIATALYCLTQRRDVYKKAIAVVIINKSLQPNVLEELKQYIDQLNAAGIGLNLLPQSGSLDFETVKSYIKFITYNDTRNFQKNIESQFDAIAGYTEKFVVMDEAHNLFRSAINSIGLDMQEENLESRGRQLYDMLMKYKDLQLLFATGTPIVNEAVEIAVCFQMLTMNKNILDPTYFNEMFINVKDMHQNRDILTRRLYGLVQYVELDESSDIPKLLPLKIEDVRLSPVVEGRYVLEKRKEQRRDFFMEASRQASNCARVQHKGKEIIVSDKFRIIKQSIEHNKGANHMIFSNFVENGCEAFAHYCTQEEYLEDAEMSEIGWELVTFDPQHGLCLKDSIKGTPRREAFGPRGEKCRIAMIHSNVPIDERVALIQAFNDPKNATGDYINVIVLSPASTEGINLFCVRFVHVVDPLWSWSLADQVIYRAVRRNSHKLLPEDHRTVQPILYLSYTIEPYNGTDFKTKNIQRSTDEHIFIQSHSKFTTSLQFMQTLSACAFNCNDYYQVAARKVKNFFGLPIEDEQVCFSCMPTNQQLFDPTSVYKDFVTNNCVRAMTEESHQVIKSRSIDYRWIFDVFSTYGVRFFEARDRARTYVLEDSDIFIDLLNQFRRLYNSPVANQTPNEHASPVPDNQAKRVAVEVVVETRQELTDQDEMIHDLVLKGSHIQLSDLIQQPAVQSIKFIDSGKEVSLSEITVEAIAIPVLVQYVETAGESIAEVLETVAGLGMLSITLQDLLKYIANERKHVLYRFVKQADTEEFLKQRRYIFRGLECGWRDICQNIGQLLIERISQLEEYDLILIAMRRALVKNESNQFILGVSPQLTYLERAILFVFLRSVANCEELQQELSVQEQTPSTPVSINSIKGSGFKTVEVSDYVYPAIVLELLRRNMHEQRRGSNLTLEISESLIHHANPLNRLKEIRARAHGDSSASAVLWYREGDSVEDMCRYEYVIRTSRPDDPKQFSVPDGLVLIDTYESPRIGEFQLLVEERENLNSEKQDLEIQNIKRSATDEDYNRLIRNMQLRIAKNLEHSD